MPQAPPRSAGPCIVVHGGAWAIPPALTPASLAGVRRAAAAGHAVLRAGGAALDAVEAAVVVLEDDPAFDAGTGSVLNARGDVEMDAAVMTEGPGTDGMRAGGVAAVAAVRNPVRLARAVMEKTPHCLLVGGGANSFAEEAGVERVADQRELVSDVAVEEWERFKKYGKAVSSLFNRGSDATHFDEERGHDTVGAVALDETGGLAVATSTGGITFKRAGRVGDSPLIGSGLYCDADIGAASTTGHGESIMKTCLARHALLLMQLDSADAAAASTRALAHMKAKTGGCGGIIIVDAAGNMAFDFTTSRMAWASVDAAGKLRSGIDRDDS